MSTKEELEEELKRLREENDAMKNAMIRLATDRTKDLEEALAAHLKPLEGSALTVVVVGASGHLARTKTFPALFQLYSQGLLPFRTNFIGYARSKMAPAEYSKQVAEKIKGNPAMLHEFQQRNSYVAGNYDSEEDFAKLRRHCEEVEAKNGGPSANRVFYFAIPPSVFAATARAIKTSALTTSGWNRVIIEKPFGNDTESYAELARAVSSQFSEELVYRIDHYLGKEMVQNLMVLRFSNLIFKSCWSRDFIKNVTITFKEDAGVEGRGGYFDEFGIVRDVMQNHLMQMLTLVAMEPPVTLGAEDIRDEKVKVLRSIRPLTANDIIVGQYGRSADGKKVGYREDPSVPKESKAPTFAVAIMEVKNPRWDGVPFILKCGKGLNERKAEVRIQFRNWPGSLFENAGKPVPPNELVLRVQPNESIYLKMLTKTPGLGEGLEEVEMDLTYHSRFNTGTLPDAYERLILDVVRGDHRLFVRSDELEHAWNIFTPVLHMMDKGQLPLLAYPFGTRGPKEADDMVAKAGFIRSESYTWSKA